MKVFVSSDIIKNPDRKISTFTKVKTYLGKKEPYQPEHVRLGLDLHNPIKIKEDKEAELNRRLEFQIAASERLKKERKMSEKIEIPKQLKVSSGSSQEHFWLPDGQGKTEAAYFDEKLSDKANSNWFEQSKSDEELEQAEILATTEEILDEDIVFTQEGFDALQEAAQDDEPEQEGVDLEIIDTPASHYCVVVKNKVIAIVDSIEEAESLVDYAVFSGKPPFEATSLEDVAVFQKLSIKAGITVGK